MKLHTLKLNNLIPHKSLSSRTSKRKRRGRGPGSGLGKTSGRGHKGQGSRSGGGSVQALKVGKCHCKKGFLSMGSFQGRVDSLKK